MKVEKTFLGLKGPDRDFFSLLAAEFFQSGIL